MTDRLSEAWDHDCNSLHFSPITATHFTVSHRTQFQQQYVTHTSNFSMTPVSRCTWQLTLLEAFTFCPAGLLGDLTWGDLGGLGETEAVRSADSAEKSPECRNATMAGSVVRSRSPWIAKPNDTDTSDSTTQLGIAIPGPFSNPGILGLENRPGISLHATPLLHTHNHN